MQQKKQYFMTYNFAEMMLKKTDEELISILTARRDEYTEPALEAAINEFQKRDISSDKIKTVETEQFSIKQKETVNANEPLEKEVKRLAMFLPFIATLAYSKKFRDGGYDRKLAELANAAFYGRLVLVGIIIAVVIISRIVSSYY